MFNFARIENMCDFCHFIKKIVLVVTFLQVSSAPAFAQICTSGYFNEKLEEESPVQRVGTAQNTRNIEIHWSQPADFTETDPFVGNNYQLAIHEGIDFIHSNQSIPQVSVRSVADGKVVYIRRGCPQSNLFEPNTEERECGAGWGNHVVILHPNGLFTRYAHLAPDTIQITVSQQIHRGEELAKMGNSGRSDMRHLHFEMGVAIEFKSCAPSQSFEYIYNPITPLGWGDLLH
ncbi:M23 family metallopeptidase [Tumidithrix elongata RA019]|uniref:M23 family metallopeptidase n=1 Tax=Tumidithrix elongata BACA0141 TaxID=2716417 RepID=A0AAW9PWI2_9CYAN|nr:M23 family metallopeptidase [Tumidithrix elongata RA019]